MVGPENYECGGVSCNPSFLLSSPASPQWIQMSAHVEGVSRWEHVSRSVLTRVAFLNLFLVTNDKLHQGPLFPPPFPSWDYSHLLFLTSLVSPQYGKSESLFPHLSLWGWGRGRASQVVLMVKNLPAYAGDTRDEGSMPGLGRSAATGNGNPLQYSFLENSMDRGAW